MSKLIYAVNTSVDGFMEDQDGNFGWTEPNDEVFKFITDLMRPIGTHLLGRRMYETMMVWETDPKFAAESSLKRDFAEVWQAANKIVFSTTLENLPTRKTQLMRSFEPETIRQLKANSEHDILIEGPEIASHAFRAGLIDECHLFILPVVVGGGKSAIPNNLRLNLELLEEQHFGNGTVYLRYRIKPESSLR